MDASEAIFSIEFGEDFCAAEFMGDFIQGCGLVMFMDNGFI